MRVRIIVIGPRAHGDEHFFAVRRELNVAGPVASGGQIRQVLRTTTGFEIAGVIGEAHDSVSLAYVDPLWVVTRRIEGDAVGSVQPTGKNGDLLRLAVVGDAAEDADATGGTFSEKNVAIWSGTNETRIVQTRSKLLHLETGGRLRPDVRRAGDEIGTVVGRVGRVRPRKIRRRNLVSV